ncbi:MAG: LPS export ABC transporter periplasmic protein LptC [Candidatus Cloacimonadia bacterium]
MKRIFIISLISLCLLSCQGEEIEPAEEETILVSKETADSLIVYNTSGDMLSWILYASHLRKLADEHLTNLWDIKLEIFDENQQLNSTIYADSASIDEKSNIISAYGNVQVYSTEGDLFGNVLIWEINNDRIYSEDWIKIVQDENTIWGTHLSTDSHFEHVILQKVSAEGEISETQVVW